MGSISGTHRQCSHSAQGASSTNSTIRSTDFGESSGLRPRQRLIADGIRTRSGSRRLARAQEVQALEFDLESLSGSGISRARELANHHRLLNEPEQPESNCDDILETVPENQEIHVTLLLALTDEFRDKLGEDSKARTVLKHLRDAYQRECYRRIDPRVSWPGASRRVSAGLKFRGL